MPRYLYALLVGINNYPNPAHRLSGCVNDIEGWKTYLDSYAKKVGYTFKLLFLQDEAATREAVVSGFVAHLAQAQKGDLAVFCFAGHGSEMPGRKKSGQCLDEINQTLVCWDSRTDNSWDLVDKELGYLISEVAENEPLITLILDCCHSGSGSRPLEEGCTARFIEPQELKRALERPIYSYVGASASLSRDVLDLTLDNTNQASFEQKRGRHILLAACHETQTAKELRFGDTTRGAFSAYMQKVLLESSNPLTYEQLLAQVRYRIIQHEIAEQTPQLEVIAGNNSETQRLFLSGEIQSDREGLFNLSYQDGWVVNGGKVNGWHQGGEASRIELAIFPFDTSPRDINQRIGKIAIARVDKVGDTFSQVRVDDEIGLNHKQLYKAVITQIPTFDELTIFLHGHEAGVEALRFSIDKLDSKLIPVREVSEIAEAMIVLKALTNTYEISQGMVLQERTSVPIVSQPYCPPSPTDIDKGLDIIWQWVRLRKLVNTDVKSPSRKINFCLLQNGKEIQGENWIGNCKLKDGRWQSLDFQLQIQNHTSAPVYCAILYLSPEFEISASLLEAGGLWVNPNGIGETNHFSVAIPESFVERGAAEYPVCLKLIVSSHEFNARVWEQKGINHEKGDRELLIKKNSDSWFTKEIVMRCVMPRTSERSPVVTERPLSLEAEH